MSGSKYFVWAESRWRELDVAKGRVDGWSRRPRFVFVQRGRLRVASRRRVLSALEALASHRPSAAGIGPRLSMRSNEHTMASRSRPKPLIETPPVLPPPPAPCAHHHCCMHSNGCNNNIKPCSVSTTTVLSQLVDAGTQHRAVADAGVQHAPPPLTISLANSPHKRPPDTTNLATTLPKRPPPESRSSKAKSGNRAPKLDSLLQQNPAKRPRQSDDSSDNFKTSKKRSMDAEKSKKTAKRAERTTSVSERSDVCKELTISESDVMALRSFVARTRSPALKRFDTDDEYKRALFYAINPLVDVERCAQTERALRERHEMALPHFAARLGLAPQGTTRATPTRRRRAHVRYRERSFSDNDKENRQAKDNTDRNKKQATAKKKQKQTSDSDYTSEVSTENRHDSLRQKTVAKSIMEDSDETRDSKGKNDNKRNSLRSRVSIKNIPNDKNSKNDKNETLLQKQYHDESDITETVSESSEKQAQRHLTTSRSKCATIEDSESSNTDEPGQNNDRRNSLRSRTENQTHKKHTREDKSTSSSDASDSVEGKSSSSDENKEKATDKRNSLRRRSVLQTNGKLQSDSESDFKTAKKLVSITKSVESVPPKTQSKTSSNETPKKSSKSSVNKRDSDSIVFKPSRAVKVSKSVPKKTQQVTTQTQTSAGSSATKEQTNTHIISKRASGNVSKEYSNLEDHAIVSWVSVGSRARLVNGNRLWRELQEAFPRVGGRVRSWHSLRNRYLRYILPGLGALHLPPADVSRLRAAAATGEVKSKRGGGAAKSRRNSIFKVSQVRAASARRPPARLDVQPATTSGATEHTPAKPAADDNVPSTSSNTTSSSSSSPPSEDEKEPTPPSQTRRSLRPRTSEVATTPAAPARTPKAAPAAAPNATRTRKLFNPKLVL